MCSLRQLVKVVGGAGVDVVAFSSGGGSAGARCRQALFAEDDADEVVGAGLVVALLHGGGDLVVGLGDDVFHVDAGGVVTEGAEGVDASHAF